MKQGKIRIKNNFFNIISLYLFYILNMIGYLVLQLCMCVCVCMCVCMCVYVCVYVCMYICMYVCMCM